MLFKKEIQAPIWALFFISFGGLFLHIRIHPPWHDAFDAIPTVFGVITTFALPFMFNCRRTVRWAYVINWAAVIAGTVGMAYYSITHWGEMPVTLENVLLQSTLADILILFAKVPLGGAILRHFRAAAEPAKAA